MCVCGCLWRRGNNWLVAGLLLRPKRYSCKGQGNTIMASLLQYRLEDGDPESPIGQNNVCWVASYCINSCNKEGNHLKISEERLIEIIIDLNSNLAVG